MDANRFFDALLSFVKKGVKISYDNCHKIFLKTFPEWKGSGDSEMKLLELLEELSASGKILKIRSRSERKTLGGKLMEIPGGVRLTGRKTDKRSAERRPFDWLPGLQFADGFKGGILIKLETINEFIKENYPFAQSVPLKERSLHIFGIEKELDRIINGNATIKSNLNLDLLGCFKITPPLIHSDSDYNKSKADRREAACNRSSKILVLENFSSYWSFAEWNREYPLFRQIVYGAGFQFQHAHEFLEKITSELTNPELYYLGDLDYSGIMIPYQTNQVRKEWGLPVVKPLTEIYSRLINNGVQVEGVKTMKSELAKCELALNDWFNHDIDLAQKIFHLIQSGQRIAQENFGFRELSQLKGDLFID